jgi:hypothetical protein
MKAGIGGATLAAFALLLTPALAATSQQQQQQKAREKRSSGPSLRTGSFTPAVADPRLAAELARRGLNAGSFRFTPAATQGEPGKALRVAVRARSAGPSEAVRRVAVASEGTVTAITPTAYNLGVSVGWKRFALSGDVARIQGGPVVNDREAAEVGVSYIGKRFTVRGEVGADRSTALQQRIIPVEDGYTVGVGGSYSLSRNLDVTGGVRYRVQRDRIETIADQRRDSQAVYIGTAFRF